MHAQIEEVILSEEILNVFQQNRSQEMGQCYAVSS